MSKQNKKSKQAGLSWKSLSSEWLAWYTNKSPVFQFGTKFGALMLLLYGLLALPACDNVLYVYLEANAWLSNIILNVMGQHSHVTDVIISSPKFAMAIRRGCDAVEPTWLFCAAVVAFPVPWKRKIMGILAGIVILQLLNLLRIVTLYFIGIHFPGFFDAAHLEIWPTIFIIVAIVLWIGWMQWSKRFDIAA